MTLLHRLYPNQNQALVELIFILDALKNIGAKVTLVTPYLPYARQDKSILNGELKGAEIICDLLASYGCQKLVTFDCHFLKKPGLQKFRGLLIENIALNQKLVEYWKGKGEKDLEIITPDEGAGYIARAHSGKTMQKFRKKYEHNRIGYCQVQTVKNNFQVAGKKILLIDDMVSTGSTMIKAVERLRAGKAKKIFCAATHGLFLKGSLEKINRLCSGICVSDSIPSKAFRVSLKKILRKY